MNLYNKDCFELLESFPDESVNAIITDPPYGILDHKIETKIDIKRLFAECYRVLKPNSFLVYFGQQPTLTTWNYLSFLLFNYKNEIIWYKRQRTSPMQDMGRVFENIMIVSKGKRKFNQTCLPYLDVKDALGEFTNRQTIQNHIDKLLSFFTSPEKFGKAVEYLSSKNMNDFYVQDKACRNDNSALSSEIKGKSRDYSGLDLWHFGIKPQNLISFTPHNKAGYDSSGAGAGEFNLKHPTVKPISLMEYLIDLCTNEGELVLDIFMGTGSTGIAARNLNREFIGCEIDPAYFAIAENRIKAPSAGLFFQ